CLHPWTTFIWTLSSTSLPSPLLRLGSSASPQFPPSFLCRWTVTASLVGVSPMLALVKSHKPSQGLRGDSIVKSELLAAVKDRIQFPGPMSSYSQPSTTQGIRRLIWLYIDKACP
ncbi:mCG145817, partial [Mus musculus]